MGSGQPLLVAISRTCDLSLVISLTQKPTLLPWGQEALCLSPGLRHQQEKLKLQDWDWKPTPDPPAQHTVPTHGSWAGGLSHSVTDPSVQHTLVFKGALPGSLLE